MTAHAQAGDLQATATQLVVTEDSTVATGVEVRSAQGPGISVEAPLSRFHLEERLAVFEGGVQATRGNLRLSCERLEVRTDENATVVTATATGSVVLQSGEWRATGEVATLDLRSETVSLSGQAQLVKGGNRMEGDRIHMDFQGKEVDCQSCRILVQEPSP
jgi:lipopolysaccharide transport protein LptA